ncbi:hypothetical protein GW17_00010171 [Ensete ventricosum]|nr:hypothetical protein GW17_00010171 [Ensete ventricosum]
MPLKDVVHLMLQLPANKIKIKFGTDRYEEDSSSCSWLDTMKRAERVDGEDEDNDIGAHLIIWKENPRAVFLPQPDARVLNGAGVRRIVMRPQEMDSGRDRKQGFGGAQRKTADDGFARGAAEEMSVSL